MLDYLPEGALVGNDDGIFEDDEDGATDGNAVGITGVG